MKRKDYLDSAKLDALYEEFYKLARERIGTDDEGRLQIDIRIIDRTRFERMHFQAVPYDDNVATLTEHDAVLSNLMDNFSIASSDLERWYRCKKFYPAPVETANDENLVNENRHLVERNKTIEIEIREIRKDVGAKIRRDSVVKDARKRRDEATDALYHVWGCTKKKCKKCDKIQAREHMDNKPSKKSKAPA